MQKILRWCSLGAVVALTLLLSACVATTADDGAIQGRSAIKPSGEGAAVFSFKWLEPAGSTNNAPLLNAKSGGVLDGSFPTDDPSNGSSRDVLAAGLGRASMARVQQADPNRGADCIGNLLVNPGFEDSVIDVAYSINGWSSTERVVSVGLGLWWDVASDVPAEGTYYMFRYNGQGDQQRVWQDVTNIQGNTELELFFLANTTYPYEYYVHQVYIESYDAAGARLGVSNVIDVYHPENANPRWNPYSITTITPAGTSFVRVVMTNENAGTYVSVDDMCLRRTDGPPVLTNPGDQTNLVNDNGNLTVTAVDAEGDPLTFSATGLPTGLNMNSDGDITGILNSAGTFDVTVTVDDGNGNSDVASFVWTVETPPNAVPSITNPGNQTNTVGDDGSLTVTANDPDGDPLTFSATGLPTGLNMNSDGDITGILNSAGIFDVTVTANDGNGGSDAASFVWTVETPPNAVPSITNPGNQTNTVGDDGSLTVTANDPDGDPLTYTVTGLPTGLTVDGTNGINGTVTTPGIFNVTIVADDGNGGTDSASFVWTVDAQPVGDPVIIRTQDATVNEGGALTVPVEVLLGQTGENAAAVGLTVNYDPNVLAAQACTFENGFTGFCNLDTAGVVNLSGINPDGMAGDFTVVGLDFIAVGAAGESTVLNIGVDSSANAAGISLNNIAVVNGQISIASAYPLGDVNCSGATDAVDALFILQYTVQQRADIGDCPAVGSATEIHAALGNVNNDPATDVVDALFILQCEVNMNNVFCPADALVAGSISVEQAAPELSGPVTVAVETVAGSAQLRASAPIAAGTFDLVYEREGASFAGCTATRATTAVCHEVRPGVVRVSYVDPQGANSSGLLAEMNFAVADGGTLDAVELQSVEAADGNGDSLSIDGLSQQMFDLYLPLMNGVAPQ